MHLRHRDPGLEAPCAQRVDGRVRFDVTCSSAASRGLSRGDARNVNWSCKQQRETARLQLDWSFSMVDAEVLGVEVVIAASSLVACGISEGVCWEVSVTASRSALVPTCCYPSNVG
jgi:hypothetical protein